MTVVEYVWIGGKNVLRSKAKVINETISKEDLNSKEREKLCLKLDDWNFDGSSTEQASGVDSEVIIKPRAYFIDPFRHDSILVLCDTYTPDGIALCNNHREWAKSIFNRAKEEHPWFGLEQEYFLIDPATCKSLGFPSDNNGRGAWVCGKAVQGQYYCSAGAQNAFGRKIVDEHLQACIKAGICISGINAEVAPGQWEFQIGPCEGIEAGDHLWMARYLLIRVAEEHGICVNFEPKPFKGDWNGSGCHTNYSTKNMREGTTTPDKTGLEYINEAIEKLSRKHTEHMELYGENNKERMTGEHETAAFDVFTDGVANRGASIRRGNLTVANKRGYFEDRRPSSNCDPYLVTAKIFETTLSLDS